MLNQSSKLGLALVALSLTAVGCSGATEAHLYDALNNSGQKSSNSALTFDENGTSISNLSGNENSLIAQGLASAGAATQGSASTTVSYSGGRGALTVKCPSDNAASDSISTQAPYALVRFSNSATGISISKTGTYQVSYTISGTGSAHGPQSGAPVSGSVFGLVKGVFNEANQLQIKSTSATKYTIKGSIKASLKARDVVRIGFGPMACGDKTTVTNAVLTVTKVR